MDESSRLGRRGAVRIVFCSVFSGANPSSCSGKRLISVLWSRKSERGGFHALVEYGTVRYDTVRCVGVLSVNNYCYIRANSYSLIKYTIVGKLSNVLVHFKNEDCLSLPTPSKCSIIQWLMSQGQLVKINGSFWFEHFLTMVSNWPR